MKKAASSAGARNGTKRENISKSKGKAGAKKAKPDRTAKTAARQGAALSLRDRIAEAKKLEALDRAPAPASPAKATKRSGIRPAAAVESTLPHMAAFASKHSGSPSLSRATPVSTSQTSSSMASGRSRGNNGEMLTGIPHGEHPEVM